MLAAIGLVKRDIVRLDGDVADTRNGIPGVNAEVSEELVEL